MKTIIVLLALSLAGLAGAQEQRAVSGDYLLINKVRSDPSEGPRRGLRMEQVEERYGEPLSRSAAVGEPPIIRWDYPEFTVYFESDSVIHTVLRRETGKESVS